MRCVCVYGVIYIYILTHSYAPFLLVCSKVGILDPKGMVHAPKCFEVFLQVPEVLNRARQYTSYLCGTLRYEQAFFIVRVW